MNHEPTSISMDFAFRPGCFVFSWLILWFAWFGLTFCLGGQTCGIQVLQRSGGQLQEVGAEKQPAGSVHQFQEDVHLGCFQKIGVP